ncbi:hypothetical protein DTB58_39860, partial [Streptomyces griseus]|nr:hypothetical protein [Streptomyces griseus]
MGTVGAARGTGGARGERGGGGGRGGGAWGGGGGVGAGGGRGGGSGGGRGGGGGGRGGGGGGAGEAGLAAGGPKAEGCARRHGAWLASAKGASRSYVSGLGERGVADPRFGRNCDRYGDGTAAVVRDA